LAYSGFSTENIIMLILEGVYTWNQESSSWRRKLTKAQDHGELLVAYSHANNSFPWKFSKGNVT